MIYPNGNKAITRIAAPEQLLPVLISAEGQDKTGETSLGVGVRRLTRTDLALFLRSRRQFEMKYGKYGQLDELQRRQINFAIELGQAIADRSVPKLKRALGRLFGEIGESALPLYQKQPLRSLADSFNPALADTHLCVWWSEVAQRLVWGVHCRSIEAALFLLALYDVGDVGAIGKCPRCKELFFRIRPSKKYCSDRCQAADGMRRKRNRERRLSKRRTRK